MVNQGTDPSTGARLLPDGYLQTFGTQIVGSDAKPVRLAGVNWYGFDCDAMVPGGLDHAPLADICRTIRTLGFNSIRLPFSVKAVLENSTIYENLGQNSSLQGRTTLQILDAVVAAAKDQGLKVILDSHRAEPGWSTQENGLWYTQTCPESAWLDAWTLLARRYAGDSTVIGCDLHNEPGAPPPPDGHAWPRNGGARWGIGGRRHFPADWAQAAERAGNSILDINSDLLIFVEGVRDDPAGPYCAGAHQLYWPGGNLSGVLRRGLFRRWSPRRIDLDVPNRLVYSVHDYGPDMYSDLVWCRPGTTGTTSRACREVWDRTWGDIVREEIAPVWLGEFGTPNGYKPGDSRPRESYVHPNPGNPQGAWFTYLIEYVAELGIHWCYWCLNGSQSRAPGRDPSRPDWYGVLTPDWSGVASRPMMDLLTTIQ